MVNPVVVGVELVHDLSREEERSRGSKEHVFALDPDPSRPDYIVKRSGVAADVVGGVGAHQVFVVGAPIEDHVPVRLGLPRGGIVSDLVGVQCVVAEPHHNVATRPIDVLVPILVVAANQHFIPTQGNVHGGSRRSRLRFVALRLNFLLNDLFSLFVFLPGVGSYRDSGLACRVLLPRSPL